MVVSIAPALIPDIEKIYDVYFSAFKNDPMGALMLNVLFPAGFESEEFRKAHTQATADYWTTADNQYTYKVLDTSTMEIIGMALTDAYFAPRTPEQRANHGVPWLEGAHRAKAEAILNPLWEARERIFGGRPYIYTHVIAIEPKHQGRKAGALICKWGAEMAEAWQLPLYFEASPSSVGLYEKMGFQKLPDTIVHKKEVLGTAEDVQVPLMVIMPKSIGMTFEEWRESTKHLA
ncbi:hypothetical protein jhhlp_001664 [Lomentospora prolificans]|uniref:N-acetyltransferase domain-containing protein n=1 Tax=Lomentospora prolificans TaxID=41688 RepID=A0A2N3NIV9_9PEZI|nr:hypothetical protein jhhlp_001664 [Lomentospora prolificans]